MLVIDTRIKLLLFILINFMVFGLKDFILGSVCFFFICILSCLMGQKKIVLKYLIFYVVIAAIQQLCAFLPQAIETILSIFTLFIRVMIPVVLFASTFKERHPMSLSGGQKQRTAIGVAALRDAEVLIFDEPTSGLDYKNMESVAGILSALSKRGKAILVISHDNELLMKICSRVIRMDEKTSS